MADLQSKDMPQKSSTMCGGDYQHNLLTLGLNQADYAAINAFAAAIKNPVSPLAA